MSNAVVAGRSIIGADSNGNCDPETAGWGVNAGVAKGTLCGGQTKCDDWLEPRRAGYTSAVLACGALAREIRVLIDRQGWSDIHLACLPADLHNRPSAIPDRVDRALADLTLRFDRVFVGYADCGTGGALDAVLARYGVDRLPGAHCYYVFAGASVISRLVADEPGTFFVTDFLARQFETLVVKGLGLDKWPTLKPMYFGNYRRLIYLAQTEDEGLCVKAESAADFLGLDYEYRFVGFGSLEHWIQRSAETP